MSRKRCPSDVSRGEWVSVAPCLSPVCEDAPQRECAYERLPQTLAGLHPLTSAILFPSRFVNLMSQST